MVLLAQVPLHAGWLPDPAGATLANPFHGVHAWAISVVADAWAAGTWPDPTHEAGFPLENRARFVGWAFLAVGAALSPVCSEIVSINAAAWLGPALGAAAFVPFARAVAHRASAAGLFAGGVVYGLAPVTLGAAASGQVENAQSWVLPVLLLALHRAAAAPYRWPVLTLLWAFGALTSPYLGLMAGLVAPWVAWRRRAWSGLGALSAAAGGLLLARAAVQPGDFDADQDVFRPNFGYDGWPDLWSLPLPVADLDTLLWGDLDVQVRTLVVHQPYLGALVLVAVAIAGAQRRRWLPPLVLGVLLALGPVLAWQEEPLRLGGQALALPAVALRWVDFPLARGGQYYRAAILASLGLAGMLAASDRRRLVVMLALAGGVDAVASLTAAGLPWPTVSLPTQAWDTWAADPTPGAVVHVPLNSQHLQPNHPVRLAGRVVHRRPLVAMPRSDTTPPRHQVVRILDACTRRGAACEPPGLAELGRTGFRYVVLDLADTPERATLLRRLTASWGAPTASAQGLVWWRLESP